MLTEYNGGPKEFSDYASGPGYGGPVGPTGLYTFGGPGRVITSLGTRGSATAPMAAAAPSLVYNAFPATAPCWSEAQAISVARTRLCAIGWPDCAASQSNPQLVKAKVLSDHTLFVGTSGEDVSIRCALGDPLPGQDCSNCEGGGGGANTTMIAIAGIGAAALIALAIASQGRKKVTVARVVGTAPARRS